MGLLIDIVYEIISAAFFFGTNPRSDTSWVMPYWLRMGISWIFSVLVISITCGFLYMQFTGAFSKNISIGRIQYIESGVSCFNCPWLSMQTAHARVQVRSTKNFAVGNDIYLTRTRLWGLQACNYDTCTAAQIYKGSDEILNALSVSK